MKRKNEEKLLKLEYDWDKTVLFAMMMMLLTSCIGYYTLNGIFKFSLIILMIACSIVMCFYFFRIKKTFREIKKIYKNN